MFKKIFFIFATIFLLGIAGFASAHQPNIIENNKTIIVTDPEISKAYYGVFQGKPQTFEIDSKSPFNLYLGILVPKLDNIAKDVSARVYLLEDNKIILFQSLNAVDSQWKEFYEPFGGDYYYQGPEWRAKVLTGKYEIKVFSATNQGKYVLAIGETEAFSLPEMIKTLGILPKLKKNFFEKSPWTALNNRIGKYLLAFLLIIIAVIILVYSVIKIVIKKLQKQSQQKYAKKIISRHPTQRKISRQPKRVLRKPRKSRRR